MVYKGTDYDWITVTYATTVCYWDAAGAGGSGDGGGSGGGYDPAPEQPQPVLSDPLKRLFVNGSSNLSATDIDNLNKAFNEMNNDCMLNSISNFLASNNITLGSVSIPTTIQIPQAKYDGVSGNLTFAGDWAISTENLSHEWFHIGQKKMNSVNLTDGYAELEAWLFFDIKETIRMSGNIESSNHDFACYKQDFTVYKFEYMNWLKSITNNGTTFPTSFASDLKYWAPKFVATRNYPPNNFINDSYLPKTMFDLFNNCK